MYRNGAEVYKMQDHSIINELSKIKNLKSSDMDRYSSVVTRSIMGDDKLGKAEVSHVFPSLLAKKMEMIVKHRIRLSLYLMKRQAVEQ